MEQSSENAQDQGGTEGSRGQVFIVDDEKLIRHHLTLILRSEGYLVQSFPSGEKFLEAARRTGPGCLLLDVALPGGIDGPSVQKHLTDQNGQLAVVFLTAHATVPMAVKAVKSGAVDVLIKPVDREVLLPVIEKALAVSRRRHLENREQRDVGILARQLTGREREVLSWIVSGKLNKEVAYLLGITERTVKAHRASIMSKLQVVSVAELVRFADKAGIVPSRE
jgi:two-component system response regulator FixJ